MSYPGYPPTQNAGYHPNTSQQQAQLQAQLQAQQAAYNQSRGQAGGTPAQAGAYRGGSQAPMRGTPQHQGQGQMQPGPAGKMDNMPDGNEALLRALK